MIWDEFGPVPVAAIRCGVGNSLRIIGVDCTSFPRIAKLLVGSYSNIATFGCVL